MKKQLQKAIDLAARTGDKIIVIDENADKGTVLMPLDEYEKIVFGQNKIKREIDSLTDEEWIDKINREITLGNGVNEDDNDNEEETLTEDDFLTSENDLEGLDDLDEDEEDFKEEPIETVAIEEVKEEVAPEGETDPEAEENLYYYEEAPLAAAPETPTEALKVETEPESEVGESSEAKKEAFTSIGEELKNRHNWEIPKNIKNGAQEVK